MRNDYYDRKWTRPSRPVRAEQTGIPGAQPYGAVPSQTGQSSRTPLPAGPAKTVRTPNVWQDRPRPRRKRNEKSGAPGFLCCLALMLGLSGLAIFLQGGLPLTDLWGTLQEGWQGTYQWPKREDSTPWEGEDPWSGDWYSKEEKDWTKDLPNTTVKRAPVGDGTTLSLNGAVGKTLTPQEIYEKVNPSVVGIQALMKGDLVGLGTGVIMSQDGYILTNAHVIAGSWKLEVLLGDGARVNALLVGYDGSTDLAVLKVERTGLPAADFGDSSLLRVGDPAYAIGNPLGEELRGTMTDGIVSAIDRVVTAQNGDMTLIQTTAALNPGNSGGALVNAAGQVVGVTNMKMMAYEDEVYEGLGFAIPTAVAKEVVDQLILQGHYSGRPMLGITVTTQYAVGETPAGALILEVDPRSDAYRKGLREGDVITAVNGETIADMDGLLRAKEGFEVDDVLVLEVWNGERRITVRVRLMDRWEMEN